MSMVFRILSIIYIEYPEEHAFSAHYLYGEDRGAEAPLNVYRFFDHEGVPSPMTNFLPNNTNLMAALEKIAALEGTVVELGLGEYRGTVYTPFAEVMEEYGLWRHRLRFDLPFYEKDDDPSMDAPAYSITHWLFVSDLQPDGTYYVGSSEYNLVAKVAAEEAAFVEFTAFDWIDPYILGMKFNSIEKLDVTWNYGDVLSGTWEFSFDYAVTGTGKEPSCENVYLKKPGDAVKSLFLARSRTLANGEKETQLWGDFSEILVYLQYMGDLELPAEEIDALRAGAPALRLAFDFGTTHDIGDMYIAFYPYENGRCMVDYNGLTAFYCYNTGIKTVASTFLQLMAKEPIDEQSRYPHTGE